MTKDFLVILSMSISNVSFNKQGNSKEKDAKNSQTNGIEW